MRPSRGPQTGPGRRARTSRSLWRQERAGRCPRGCKGGLPGGRGVQGGGAQAETLRNVAIHEGRAGGRTGRQLAGAALSVRRPAGRPCRPLISSGWLAPAARQPGAGMPAHQLKHAFTPMTSAWVPGWHAAHAVAPGSAENEPAGLQRQGGGVVRGVDQSSQGSWVVSPLSTVRLPGPAGCLQRAVGNWGAVPDALQDRSTCAPNTQAVPGLVRPTRARRCSCCCCGSCPRGCGGRVNGGVAVVSAGEHRWQAGRQALQAVR